MADAQHKLSRRAVLGAALIPVLGPLATTRHSGLDPESSSPPARQPSSWTPDQVRGDALDTRHTRRWNRALARYRRAEAALAAAAHTPDQALYDRLGAVHDRALARLLATPAPHLAGLADKLDLTLAHQAWELAAAEAALADLPADARRLAARS